LLNRLFLIPYPVTHTCVIWYSPKFKKGKYYHYSFIFFGFCQDTYTAFLIFACWAVLLGSLYAIVQHNAASLLAFQGLDGM
jgi:formate hydrogenlyase subunit 3/multisubunit Na+/H+ antiporter MnhD subunit